MKQMHRDYKNLQMPDHEMSFTQGFTMALLLITVVLKLTGVIP